MNLPNRRPLLTYKQAGVDVAAGNRLVDRIKPAVARTQRDGVLGGIGGFGGLFEIPAGYRRPVLVAGADGVGTKLRLALDTGRHDGVGIDLVAMCVNDVLAQGAEPLFFLDYYATAKLDEDTAATVVESIAKGCVQAGCALLGGETAEMPGMYAAGDYDLAGFCVGVVDYDNMITGDHITAGDAVIALGSSGPHSNGYSLVRALLERAGPAALDLSMGSAGGRESETLADALLAPTRIYAKPVLALHKEIPLRGVAHVTGGGLTENLPRMLPDGVGIAIDTGSWALPPVFQWLQETAACDDAEMRRTFNCGVGLVVCIAADQAAAAIAALTTAGETAWQIGDVVPHDASPDRVSYST